MPTPDRKGSSVRAHVVMSCHNNVLVDSRVRKAAASAVKAGYRVTIVGGHDPNLPDIDTVDGIDVIRVRIDPQAPKHGSARLSGPLSWRARAQGWLRRIRWRAEGTGGRALFARPLAFLLHVVMRPSPHKHGRTDATSVAQATPTGDEWFLPHRRVDSWFDAWPTLVQYSDAHAPVIAGLKPDLVHVNDVHVLPGVLSAVSQLRRNGHHAKVIYDVHEWWPGVAMRKQAKRDAIVSMEADLIHHADRVITVGPELAKRLTKVHGLDKVVDVVENCPPLGMTSHAGRRSLREEIGLEPSVPLLVYSGHVDLKRGVTTVLHAMLGLPDVHLALVTRTSSAPLTVIMTTAMQLGVADRVHSQPYVDPQSVGWYLSSANIGLAPFYRTPSHDSAVATKISEYLHAGLPVVASDCLSQRDLIEETGVGVIFTAEDSNQARDAITQALANEGALRKKITPQLIKERSWETQQETLLKVYQELLDAPDHSGPGWSHTWPAKRRRRSSERLVNAHHQRLTAT